MTGSVEAATGLGYTVGDAPELHRNSPHENRVQPHLVEIRASA